MSCCLSTIAAIIVGIQFFTKVLPWFYQNIIGPMILGQKINYRIYDWAMVTGATDGIGKSYARQLAAQGVNIILVSRTQSKLESVAAEIEKEFKVQTKVIAVDFSKGPEIYKKISDEIEGIAIGILVNNVGVSYTHPEFFLDVPDRDKTFDQIINCNIVSVVQTTKVVLPAMVRNHKGIILNIASMSGTISQPLLAVYSASKAFVDKLSEDLNTEYGSKGIIVQSVLPGFVVTNMTKLRRATLMTPSADQYVSSALKTVGYAKHTCGYLPHAIMQLFLRTFWVYAPDLCNIFTLSMMKKIRDKALKLNQKFAEKQKLAEKNQ